MFLQVFGVYRNEDAWENFSTCAVTSQFVVVFWMWHFWNGETFYPNRYYWHNMHLSNSTFWMLRCTKKSVFFFVQPWNLLPSPHNFYTSRHTSRATANMFQQEQALELLSTTTETITIAMTTAVKMKKAWTIWSKKRLSKLKEILKGKTNRLKNIWQATKHTASSLLWGYLAVNKKYQQSIFKTTKNFLKMEKKTFYDTKRKSPKDISWRFIVVFLWFHRNSKKK